MSESPRPALGELARRANAVKQCIAAEDAYFARSHDFTSAEAHSLAQATASAKAMLASMCTSDCILQLVALATGGAETARNQRIVDLVCAEGSVVRPSTLNPGRVIVIDGRTGLDACERSAAEGFDALFEEADGGDPPLRVEITVGAARSLTPERPADA
jgi:hypothetical protein